MRFMQRFIGNVVATFLALYLVDSVAQGRFVLRGVAAGVILALLLGFGNSLIRPLHRARAKPLNAVMVSALTILANAFVMQVLAWAGALSTANFGWVLLAAAFVALVTGAISRLIGFGGGEKSLPASSRVETARPAAGQTDRVRSTYRRGH